MIGTSIGIIILVFFIGITAVYINMMMEIGITDPITWAIVGAVLGIVFTVGIIMVIGGRKK